ncbi:MAG: hypothetical protein IPQ16_15245 [Geobacteraceae bacterium]|nr:hypothetical protein [Geobacteraceae bacterium]
MKAIIRIILVVTLVATALQVHAASPSATTIAASSITNTSGTLNGQGNPNGATTTGWFRYAATNPGTCNDSFGSRAPVAGGSSLGSGTSNVAYQQSIGGLSAGSTYYYCAITQSTEGTGFGSVLSFTTANVPIATTNAATTVTSSVATLNGSGNPNLGSTTGWFRYAATNPGTCNDVFGTRLPSSSLNEFLSRLRELSGSLLTIRQRASSRDDLLLLRHSQQPLRQCLWFGPLLHLAAGRPDCNDRRLKQSDRHQRHAERLVQPGR